MSRRRTSVAAISLFSFQDIITSVTGVIIFITLLLAVELVRRKSITPTPVAQSTSPMSSETLELLDKQIKSAHETLKSGESLIAQVAVLPTNELLVQEAELSRTVADLSNDLGRYTAIDDQNDADDALTSEDLPRLQNELIKAQTRTSRLKANLKSLTDQHLVIYNRNPLSQKSAWLVDLSPDTIRVAESEKTDHFLEFNDGSDDTAVRRFLGWAKQRDRKSEYFVLLLRPKSIKQYEEVHRQLTKAGFDSGVDLIESDTTVMESFDKEGVE